MRNIDGSGFKPRYEGHFVILEGYDSARSLQSGSGHRGVVHRFHAYQMGLIIFLTLE